MSASFLHVRPTSIRSKPLPWTSFAMLQVLKIMLFLPFSASHLERLQHVTSTSAKWYLTILELKEAAIPAPAVRALFHPPKHFFSTAMSSMFHVLIGSLQFYSFTRLKVVVWLWALNATLSNWRFLPLRGTSPSDSVHMDLFGQNCWKLIPCFLFNSSWSVICCKHPLHLMDHDGSAPSAPFGVLWGILSVLKATSIIPSESLFWRRTWMKNSADIVRELAEWLNMQQGF